MQAFSEPVEFFVFPDKVAMKKATLLGGIRYIGYLPFLASENSRQGSATQALLARTLRARRSQQERPKRENNPKGCSLFLVTLSGLEPEFAP